MSFQVRNSFTVTLKIEAFVVIIAERCLLQANSGSYSVFSALDTM